MSTMKVREALLLLPLRHLFKCSGLTTVKMFSILFFFLQGDAVFCRVKLPRLISDGIVLQRNKEINIWGWADAGEKVSVDFLGKTYTTTTAADQKWKLEMAPQKEGGPYVLKIHGSNEIIVSDILIGDVWLCSGQSNMAYLLERSKGRYPQEIASSDNHFIRQFFVKPSFDFHLRQDCNSEGWIAASPVTVENFTALGYFFAREIYEHYKIPIGLINSSVGGTPAEAWISEDGLQSMTEYLEKYHFYQDPENVKNAQAFNKRTQDSLKSTLNRTLPVKFNHQPVSLYNAMIAPLIPFAIKGVLWYQGEANTGDPYSYRKLFPALIQDWRKQFKQSNLPFLYVQLANYGKQLKDPASSNVALLREAQSMALSLPYTGMAVIHDSGDGNMHPTDKKTVGYRLSLIARNQVYGEKSLIYSGAMYQSMKASGNKIVLSFSHIESPLAVKGGGDALHYFSIAGRDQKFVWANAKLQGDSILVWSDAVANPVAVRYAWASNPVGGDLYNKEGLPVSSFRTDKWADTDGIISDEQ